MGSGMDCITGWLSVFTCFNKDGNFLGKYTPEGGDFPRIGNLNLCHNVVSCPVKVDDNGHEYDGTLFSGQAVCEGERVEQTGHPTVRPRDDWCLAVAPKE